MADGFIQVPADSVGKKVDTSELTVGANTVERQRFNVSDPATAAAVASVLNSAPAGTEYGLVTRNVPSGTQSVAPQPSTSGGCSISHTVAAASTNAASIKASGGQVYLVSVYNAAMYPVFVKLFNKAAAPTLGTDTPVATIGVQSGLSRDVIINLGAAFATGIAIAITKAITDSDNTAVAASDCVVDVYYK